MSAQIGDALTLIGRRSAASSLQMPFTTLESHARDISTPWDIWAWDGSGDGDGSSDGDGHNDACSDGDGPFPAGPRQPKACSAICKAGAACDMPCSGAA